MSAEWEQALLVAASALPATQWRGALSSTLSSAAGVASAAVLTCPKNDLVAARGNVSPSDDPSFIDRILNGHIAPDEVCVVLRSSGGVALGAIALRLVAPKEELLSSLQGVCDVAAHTLETAIDLAASCGAVVRSEPDPRLSKREREIAGLVCHGLSDLNIAATLAIGETTVGTHLHHIYRKLGVHTRVDLARKLGGA